MGWRTVGDDVGADLDRLFLAPSKARPKARALAGSTAVLIVGRILEARLWRLADQTARRPVTNR